jgi:hypothetical protein
MNKSDLPNTESANVTTTTLNRQYYQDLHEDNEN